MDIYDIWIDGDGNHHKICEMATRYINSCVKKTINVRIPGAAIPMSSCLHKKKRE